jgi:hypothetical protein
MILKVVNNMTGMQEDAGFFILGDVVSVNFITNRSYAISHLPEIAREHGIHNHQDCYGHTSTFRVPNDAGEVKGYPPTTVHCALLFVKTKDSSWLVTFDETAYLCNDLGKTVEKFSGSAN